MNVIALQGMDDVLKRALQERAEREGRAVEDVIVDILREACRRDDEMQEARHDTLASLAGTWSDDETEEFNRALAEQRRIDAEDWQ